MLTFKQFLNKSQLKEGIAYLEDLPIDEFIDSIENMQKMIISEKLDGSNLWMGFTNDGKFYTSREGKRKSDFKYKPSDYGVSSSVNGFKAAHATLKKNEEVLKKIIQPGEAVEIEILFGRQPNSITYGLSGFNFIAFLRMIPGTDKDLPVDQSKIKKLIDQLKNKTTSVKTVHADTIDGIEVIEQPVVTNWKFVNPEYIDSNKLDSVDLESELINLKDYLNKTNTKVSGDYTNYEVMMMPLNSVGKENKEDFKKEKELINDHIMSKFKLSIKEKILNSFVRKIKPKLQDLNIDDNEDAGIEGLVFLDPETQKQFKVIDKDVFTALNKFNYNVRNNLYGAIRTTDPNASLASRGGLTGETRIRMTSLFNIPELNNPRNVKKILSKFRGASEDETLENFSNSLSNINENDVKIKMQAILNNSIKELEKQLINFKENYKTYKLKLKNGKEIGYSQEIVKRTLLSFAETRKILSAMKKDISEAENMKDVLSVLFGNKVKELHQGVEND